MHTEWRPRPENRFLQKVERSLPRKRMVSSHIRRMDVQTIILQRACLFCPDSKATKFGGKPGSKPGGKKPYKPFNNAEKKNKPWKTGDHFNKQNRVIDSTADGGSQKRKKPPIKSKRGEEDEGGVAVQILVLSDDFKFFCYLLMLFTTNLQHGAKHCYTIIDTIKDLQQQKVQFILRSFFSPMPHSFF